MGQLSELDDLIGAEVGSVAFVRDYVEINFDGPIVRSLSSPIINVGGADFRFPDAGSRDALCELIGTSLEGVHESDAEIVLRFDAATLVIPKQGDTGAEIAHFVPFAEGRLMVEQMLIW